MFEPISAELQAEVEKLKSRIPEAFSKTIDVDEGWYQIIVDCDEELTQIDPHYQITQIKEKFGGLRYYFHPSQSDTSKAMNEVVSKYEAIAARTCEATGGSGVLMESVGGRRKTLNSEYAGDSRLYGKYKVVNNSGEK